MKTLGGWDKNEQKRMLRTSGLSDLDDSKASACLSRKRSRQSANSILDLNKE